MEKCLIALIETQPRKSQTKKPLDIAFSSKYIIRNAPDGPLYIVG